MQLTKGDIQDLALAMRDWEQIKQKDKQADITEERILKISGSVKFNIITNWGRLKKTAEAIDEVLNDKFKELGGQTNGNGEGYWVDPKDIEKLRLQYKSNKKKLLEQLEEKENYIKQKQEAYDAYRKEVRAEVVFDNCESIRGIKPTLEDIILLPISVLEWYQERLLLTEPEWEDEEPAADGDQAGDDKQKKKKQ